MKPTARNEFFATVDNACGLFKDSLDAATAKDIVGAEKLLDRAYRALKDAWEVVPSEEGEPDTAHLRMLAASFTLVAKNFHHVVDRSDKAMVVIDKSVALLEHCGAQDDDYFDALDLVARIKLEDGDIEGYESTTRKALASAECLYGRSHPTTAKWLLHLGDARREQGCEDEARALHGEAVKIVEQAVGSDHELVAQLKELTAIDFTPPAGKQKKDTKGETTVLPQAAPSTVDTTSR